MSSKYVLYENSLSVNHQNPKYAAEKLKELCTVTKENKFKQKIDCYVDALHELTLQKDTDFAFNSLFELQKIDESAKSCHFMLHGIGRATYDKNPDKWHENLQKMPTECDYGGLHGILEGYQNAGGIVSKNTTPALCGKDLEGGCIHAVGHLLLVEEKNNLPEALGLCESYNSREESHHCMAGVFMEHMIPRNLISHGYVNAKKINNWWESIDEYEHLCRTYSGDEAVACWTEISHAAARKFRSNPNKVFEYCNSGVSHEAANSCRRHVIIDIVGASNFNLQQIKYMCKLVPDYDPNFEADCYDEVAKSAIIGLHSDLLGDINKYCNSLELSFQKSCYGTASNAIGKRFLGINERKKVCMTFPIKYQNSCVKVREDRNLKYTTQ